jgi:hypothetical protein
MHQWVILQLVMKAACQGTRARIRFLRLMKSANKDVHKSIGSLKGIGAATASEVRMILVRWLSLAHAAIDSW